MAIVALSRWSVFEVGGNVVPGLVIALLGLLTNGWFWRRYTILTREKYNAVTEAQQGLYRAKASVDLCVVVALAAVAVAPTHPAATCCGAGCGWPNHIWVMSGCCFCA